MWEGDLRMPRVRETREAYIVEPTWGESFNESLAQMLLTVRQTLQQQAEQKYNRMQLRMKYNELSPEQQALLAKDPDFIQGITGKRPKKQKEVSGIDAFVQSQDSYAEQGFGKAPKRIPGKAPTASMSLPIRDLTPEEVTSRKRAQQELKLGEQALQKNDLDIKAAELMHKESLRKIAAYEKIDKIPVEQLTLMDFAVAYPDKTWDERAALFTEKRYPGLSDKIAQLKTGAGPEVDRINIRAAFEECTNRFGKADKDCFAYSEAVGTNNLDKLEKLTNRGMKTLAYKNFELNTRQVNEGAKQLEQTKNVTITNAAMRIIDDDPRIPMNVARSMATKLVNGQPFGPEENKWDVNRAALKAEMTRMTTAKLMIDMEEQTSGIKGLQSIIDQHLKVVAQETGVPADVKKLSTEQLEKLMPELTKRVTAHFGIPAGAVEKDEGGFFSGVYNFIRASVGLASDLGGSQSWIQGVEENVRAGRNEMFSELTRPALESLHEVPLIGAAAVNTLKNLGKAPSAALEAALKSVDNFRKAAEGLGVTKDQMKMPPIAKPGSFKLDADQTTHLQNVTLEVTNQLRDRSLPLSTVNALSKLLDMIEDAEKGKIPFTAVIDARVNQ
jgi:hypothetical protein